MNNLDRQYVELLNDILLNGHQKTDRTGTGTLSVFGRTIRHNMKEGFPLLTTKKVHFKSVATELFWFLQGRTDLRWLLEQNNTIWVGDAYKNYTRLTSSNSPFWNKWMRDNGDGTLSMYTEEEFKNKIKNDDEFSKVWGNLGPIYGYQWKHWDVHDGGNSYIDQILALVETLRENPDSRRMMVNAWNVAEIGDMVLPPCHYGFQCYTRDLTLEERMEWYAEEHIDWTMVPTHEFFDSHNAPKKALSLKWNQRSVDTPLGLPFNIASYGLLLVMLATEVNMIPDELIGDLGDTHIYLNQIEGAQEQIKREGFDLPHVYVDKLKGINCTSYDDIRLVDYKSQPAIKFPLSN